MNTDYDYIGAYMAFWPTTATQRALWRERFLILRDDDPQPKGVRV